MERSIKRITDVAEQDAENYRYWQSRPDWERMEAVADLVRTAYYMKGIDLDVQRSERSLTRIERERSSGATT